MYLPVLFGGFLFFSQSQRLHALSRQRAGVTREESDGDSSKSAFGSVLPSLRSAARLQSLSSLSEREVEEERGLGMQGPGMEESRGQQREVGRIYSPRGDTLFSRASPGGWRRARRDAPASAHERHLRHGLDHAIAAPARRYESDVARAARHDEPCVSALCRAALRLRMAREGRGEGGGGRSRGAGRSGSGGAEGSLSASPLSEASPQSLAAWGANGQVDVGLECKRWSTRIVGRAAAREDASRHRISWKLPVTRQAHGPHLPWPKHLLYWGYRV